jgi:hypothetical protein
MERQNGKAEVLIATIRQFQAEKKAQHQRLLAQTLTVITQKKVSRVAFV